ncbi:MAG: TRAP transporter small permease [Proteobacteria bacterium]|nr:TRAP transporter small permease [Pseudomonadota bacterium]MCL2307469.1 TRAP transporter small permease [Pseudomonadota bacterium]
MFRVFNLILNRLEELIVAVLMAGATIITFLAVAHRYMAGYEIPYLQNWLLSLNFSWAQELCIYMFVWMAKFGAAYGVRTGIHVGIDVVINRLKERARYFCILFSMGAGALFTGVIGYMGAKFVWGLSQTTSVSPDLEIPVWIVYSAIPLGSFLMCYRFLQVAWAYAWTRELPHHDHSHVEGLEEEVKKDPASDKPQDKEENRS